LINEIWPRNSVGVADRVALYPWYSSVRKVWSETSNATATWSGCSSRNALMSIEKKPYTALVTWPVEVEKFSTGRAKNARKAMEWPSTRRRRDVPEAVPC